MTCYQISEKGLELVKRISQKEKAVSYTHLTLPTKA